MPLTKLEPYMVDTTETFTFANVLGAKAYKTTDVWDILSVFNGSKRWYATSTFIVTNVNAFLVTAPTGSSVIFRINKNGVSAATVTMTANSTSVSSSLNIAMLSGDYITVDITQIGSVIPGAYLSMVFTYQ